MPCPEVARRLIATIAIVFALLLVQSCSFMRAAPADSSGVTYETMSTLIDEVARGQASGADYKQWMIDHDLARWIDSGSSWDATLGRMYARRASTLVMAAPVASLTYVWVSMASSDYRRNSDASTIGYVTSLVLFVPLTLCADVVLVPTSFVVAAVQDQMVDPVMRDRALLDLERARALGVDDPLPWW